MRETNEPIIKGARQIMAITLSFISSRIRFIMFKMKAGQTSEVWNTSSLPEIRSQVP